MSRDNRHISVQGDSSNQVSGLVLAGKWLRVANFVIDAIAYWILTFIVGFLIGVSSAFIGFGLLNFVEPVPDLLVGIPVYLAYFIILEALFGRTIGKMITGTRVVNELGGKPSLGQVVVRSLARLIPFELLSFLGSGRGWHDSIPNTYVINYRSRPATMFSSQPTGGMAATQLSTQAPVAWLQIGSGRGTDRSVPIQASGTSIGRAADNDIVIDDPAISRHHARISYSDGQCTIEDLGSVSGTLVEGSSSTRSILRPGVKLRIGETDIVFMQPGEVGGTATVVASPRPVGSGEAPPSGAPAQPAMAPAQPARAPAQPGQRLPAETAMMPAQPGVLAWLAITAGPQQGKTYQLSAGTNTIGRDQENDFVINDPSVSRQHALIRAEDANFVLADLGSSSGTSVGGRTLNGKLLLPGGRITIGQTRLQLMTVEGRQSAASAANSGDTVLNSPTNVAGAVLLVESGPDAGKSFPLSQGDTVVGRQPDAGVLLIDGTVSRRHCVVRSSGEGFMVFDLGSGSGTQVDGEPIQGYSLTPGEPITLGQTVIVLMGTEPQR